MTTHTDRIRQMAQEAGADESAEGLFLLSGEDLSRFAQLIAKDCASIADLYGMPEGSSQAAINISNAIKARFGIEDQV